MRPEEILGIVVVLAAIGFYCVGRLHTIRAISAWKIRCIELEHDLALAQGRKPRDLEQIKRNSQTQEAHHE